MIENSNALAFVTRRLLGKRQNICDYITFCWLMCGFMRLATPQFEPRLQKGIRMGIVIFKIFI